MRLQVVRVLFTMRSLYVSPYGIAQNEIPFGACYLSERDSLSLASRFVLQVKRRCVNYCEKLFSQNLSFFSVKSKGFALLARKKYRWAYLQKRICVTKEKTRDSFSSTSFINKLLN